MRLLAVGDDGDTPFASFTFSWDAERDFGGREGGGGVSLPDVAPKLGESGVGIMLGYVGGVWLGDDSLPHGA